MIYIEFAVSLLLLGIVGILWKEVKRMKDAITALTAQVGATVDALNKGVTAVQTLVGELQAANDPALVQAVADATSKLKTATDAFSAILPS